MRRLPAPGLQRWGFDTRGLLEIAIKIIAAGAFPSSASNQKSFKPSGQTCISHKKTGHWPVFLWGSMNPGARRAGEKKSLATRANPLAGKNDPFELVASPGVAPR
jgi:hypothetical protein